MRETALRGETLRKCQRLILIMNERRLRNTPRKVNRSRASHIGVVQCVLRLVLDRRHSRS